MSEKDLSVTIRVDRSPEKVFNAITRSLSEWWGGDDLQGSTIGLNDEFVIHHPGAHFSQQRIIELIPDRKVVWLVTESTLAWLTKDQHEWTGTKMVFEIARENDQTVLHFTHEGLAPEKECYGRVSEGWNTIIEGRLVNLINSRK